MGCRYRSILFLSMGVGLALSSCTGSTGSTSAAMMMCGDAGEPLLSVADVNGSGVVDDDDVVEVAHAVEAGTYYAIYDRNGDDALTEEDVALTARDIGKESTVVDRELYTFYDRFRYLQTTSVPEVVASGYQPFPLALQYHGIHWLNQSGMASVFLGTQEPNPEIAEGLNIQSDNDKVWAMFWGAPAVPVFEGGATDYPWGEEWKTQRVVAFGDTPPQFTSSEHETWHAHASLCVTWEMDAGATMPRLVANQYMTYAECQEQPNIMPNPDGSNMWINIWMMHMWLFDLNPNGVFANTHPCAEPNGVPEDSINGDREVPPFFQAMHDEEHGMD